MLSGFDIKRALIIYKIAHAHQAIIRRCRKILYVTRKLLFPEDRIYRRKAKRALFKE